MLVGLVALDITERARQHMLERIGHQSPLIQIDHTDLEVLRIGVDPAERLDVAGQQAAGSELLATIDGWPANQPGDFGEPPLGVAQGGRKHHTMEEVEVVVEHQRHIGSGMHDECRHVGRDEMLHRLHREALAACCALDLAQPLLPVAQQFGMRGQPEGAQRMDRQDNQRHVVCLRRFVGLQQHGIECQRLGQLLVCASVPQPIQQGAIA